MTTDTIREMLRAEVYPSIGDDAALIGLIRVLAARMASARGLDAPVAETELPTSFDGVDWRSVDVRLLGDVYGDRMQGRHAQGSYYTPKAMADQVVAWTLIDRPERVLDPAMGAGHFLIAAAEWLAGADADSQKRWDALRGLHGADLDGTAVEIARLALWLWAGHAGTRPDDLADRIMRADSLADGVWNTEFDAVIGNPPYASVFTRAHGDQVVGGDYETASGSYDLSVPFVERAIRLTRAGGRCGLVLPNKLLAADYARALRGWLSEHVTVEVLADFSASGGFAADVYPIAMVVRRGVDSCQLTVVSGDRKVVREQGDLRGAPGEVWSPVLDTDFEQIQRCWQGDVRPLGEIAEIAAGLTVSEAYNLRAAVIEAPPNLLPSGFVPLVTTGLIQRHRVMWSKTRTQFLKSTYRRPVAALHALPDRRRGQAEAAKILIAGMGLTPRAALDRGQTLASVSTLIITRADWPLGALCALLNSEIVARLYRALYGGLAMSGGYLRFGKRELARLPIPNVAAGDARVARLDALGWQAAAGTIDEAAINALAAALYGIPE